MNFPENLKKYRKAAGYALAKDFAAFLGLPYSTYIGYETGAREPRQDMLCRIADALHVSPSELLGFAPVSDEKYVNLCRFAGFTVSHDDAAGLVEIRTGEDVPPFSMPRDEFRAVMKKALDSDAHREDMRRLLSAAFTASEIRRLRNALVRGVKLSAVQEQIRRAHPKEWAVILDALHNAGWTESEIRNASVIVQYNAADGSGPGNGKNEPGGK